MQTTRTFVAIGVSEALGIKLRRLQSLLAPEIPNVRWSEVLPFHVTLAFLGDVHNTDLNRVCQAVEEACKPFIRLELLLGGLGVFPNPQRPRTLWVGLSGVEFEGLAELRAAVVAAVADTGYPADENQFQPHVTLGRMKSKRGESTEFDLTPLLNHYRNWAAGMIPIDEVVTYASSLTKEGPVYAPLARARLRSRKSRPKP
ncbi:RNA 2',3'-cyclic phosphodiesterase [Singulisphaera rosea]